MTFYFTQMKKLHCPFISNMRKLAASLELHVTGIITTCVWYSLEVNGVRTQRRHLLGERAQRKHAHTQCRVQTLTLSAEYTHAHSSIHSPTLARTHTHTHAQQALSIIYTLLIVCRCSNTQWHTHAVLSAAKSLLARVGEGTSGSRARDRGRARVGIKLSKGFSSSPTL